MKKSRFLALIVALMMVFSVSATSYAASFCDVSNAHWAFANIMKLKSCGAIGGFGDGTFRPNQTMTRAEFSKMLTGLYRADEEFDITFADVADSAWYANSAETMSGFMPSYIDDQNVIRFKANEKLSRADAATAILFFFGKFDMQADTANAAQYADYNNMSALEKLVAANALREGIMNGKNGKFDAQGNMTRAEVSTLLARVLSKSWTPVLRSGDDFAINSLHHPDGGRAGGYYISFYLADQETPEMPDNPEIPDNPEEKPDVPVIPDEPNTPENPDEPEIPNKPEEKPDVPVIPDEPNTPEIPEEPETPSEPDVDIGNQSYEKQVLTLVNQERAKQGLSALSWSDELANVARAHSKDMATRNFFSHTNPDGKSPFDRIKAAGISYRTAGENIAAGQRTPQEVVNAWMNSEGHRANILNKNYTKLGVGYVSGGGSYSTYWTQCFAG